MSYQNPKIPEGINVSRQTPVREFFLLTGGVFGVIAIAVTILMYSASYLAQFIPFAWENHLVNAVDLQDDVVDSPNPQLQQSLNVLCKQLEQAMGFPAGMSVTAHWLISDQMNAFATLGGHIFLFSELGQQLDSEQGLAMVLAHEMAHVRLRHPLRNVAGTATVQLLMALLGNQSSINSVGALGVLSYSRHQESDADTLALAAVAKVFGNVSGALDFFEQARLMHDEPPAWLSTHPATDDRIQLLRQLISEHHWSAENSQKIPLPVVYFSGSASK